MKSITALKITAVILFLVITTSCSLWKNFTTYFNTYYNAKSLFDITEEEILKQKKDPFEFREDYKPTQPQPQQQMPRGGAQPVTLITPTLSQSQINQNLTKVIEKCSKILQFDTESAYFDDALFLTGKSFYYQQEYARAQRKFLELATLKESDHFFENKLWLAKTYLQLRSFEEGLKLIEEVKTDAINQKNEVLFINASITKIGFYLFRQENRLAVEECNKFLSESKNDEFNALVSFQLGKIYLKLNDTENALKSFASVLSYSPTFEIEFESRLEYAKLLMQLKKYDEAESVLFDLRDGGKFNNQMDRILVEVGQYYYVNKEIENAIEVFKDIDTTYRYAPSAGIAQFKLGEIYEREIRDYDSTLKYYNKVVFSSFTGEEKYIASQRNRNFDKYFQLRNKKNELTIQIEYLENPDKFVRDSIDYDIAYNEYLEDLRKKAEQANVGQQQQQNPELRQQVQQQQPITTTNKNEKVSLATLISLGKVKKPVRPLISKDSMATLISQNYYELGNLFFSELEVPDSAFFYYQTILSNFSGKPIYTKTLYALGTYYETIEEKEKADSLFKIIYDEYPQSDLYNEAAKKLGLLKEEEKIVVQSSDPAEGLFVTAEEKYYDKKYREAIKEFREIYLNHPRSNFSPKAIYYIGLIHEELHENDSAAFYYGILSSKEYASTPLGRAVYAKYNEYKTEKERLEKIELEKIEAARIEEEKRQAEKQKALEESSKVVPDSSAMKKDDIILRRAERDEVDRQIIRKDSLKINDIRKPSDTSSVKKAVPDSIKKKLE